MRVLHVHSGNIFGGIETILLRLAKYQDYSNSLHQSYALCFEGRFGAELRKLGVPVHSLDAVRIRNPFSVRRARRKLRALLAQEHFDCVLFHSAWTYRIFGPVLRESRICFGRWFHGPRPDHWLERISEQLQPDFAFFNSKFTASSFGGLFPTTFREVLYCPFAPDFPPESFKIRTQRRAEEGISEDTAVILQVSRFESWKGQEILLKALSKLPNHPKWVCWLVGAPNRKNEPFRKKLIRLTSQLGIDHQVRFFGERADVQDLMMAADIYCQPNLKPEGFGMTFVEALSRKVPVITSNIGAAPEIVDESCGILLPAGDIPAVSAALNELLCNPERRMALGTAGFERIQILCNPETQMNLLEKTLLNTQLFYEKHSLTQN